MKIPYKLHMLHRCWRYRLRTEKESIRYILSINKKIQSITAIDIGANRGIYSYWLSKQVSKGGQIIAFEPRLS